MTKRRLAHDLRTPLAAMRNALDAMRLRPHDPQTTAWACALMERQVEEMKRLIDALAAVEEEKKARL